MAPASPLPMDPIAEAKRQWIAHGWADAADAMAAFSSVMRAHQLMYSRVDAVLKPLGLSYARLELVAAAVLHARRRPADGQCQRPPPGAPHIRDKCCGPAGKRSAGPARGPPHRRPGHPGGADRCWAELAEEATAVLNAEVFATPGIPAADLRTMTPSWPASAATPATSPTPVQYPDPL